MSDHPHQHAARERLSTMSGDELRDLLMELYGLSRANRSWIHDHLEIDAPVVDHERLYHARAMVSEHINPDPPQAHNLAMAELIITNYEHDSGDLRGTLQLMLHMVEQGAEFTLYYGDIDEDFYDGISDVARRIGDRLDALSAREQDETIAKLKAVQRKVRMVGWGFPDELEEIIEEIER